MTCLRCGALCRPDRQFTVDAMLQANLPALLMRCLNGHTQLERPAVVVVPPVYQRTCLGCGGPLAFGAHQGNVRRHPEGAAPRRLALQALSKIRRLKIRRRVRRSIGGYRRNRAL